MFGKSRELSALFLYTQKRLRAMGYAGLLAPFLESGQENEEHHNMLWCSVATNNDM